MADSLAEMENETPGDTLPDVKAEAIVAILAASVEEAQHETFTISWLI